MDLAHVKDALAKSYFTKFKVRVEVLPEYQKRQAYSDVIRESQEALELFIKALLRHMGHEPSHSHDPGRELLTLKDRVPPHFSPLVDDLAKWSKALRKDRELSYYGAADFVPTDNYTETESADALEFLQLTYKTLVSWRNK